MELVLIAVGGALGAVSRYWMSGWVAGATGGSFPWGTLVVNVLGSFLLGFVLVLLDAMLDSTTVRALVAVGFLGAFTTFSPSRSRPWRSSRTESGPGRPGIPGAASPWG